MDETVLEILKENYPKRAMELTEGYGLVNIIYEDLINDLINDTQMLQENKLYDEVIELINMQKNINNLIEKNIEIIEALEVNSDIDMTEDEEIDNKAFETPDYEEYAVNSRTPHNLYENFKHKRPHAFELNDKYVEVSTWRDMLIKTAEYLHKQDPKIFESFVTDKSMNGKKRANFTKNRNVLRKSERVNGTKIYMETNKSSTSIKQLIMKMLKKYGISISSFTIYLRADYTELHKN